MPDFTGVSRQSDRHLYEQIADAIEAAIASGELRPGQPVPSERYIMQSAGASRWAVRHAIAYLRDKGTVYTRRNLGTFVSPPAGK
jgi:GntR family transcriptional regulator